MFGLSPPDHLPMRRVSPMEPSSAWVSPQIAMTSKLRQTLTELVFISVKNWTSVPAGPATFTPTFGTMISLSAAKLQEFIILSASTCTIPLTIRPLESTGWSSSNHRAPTRVPLTSGRAALVTPTQRCPWRYSLYHQLSRHARWWDGDMISYTLLRDGTLRKIIPTTSNGRASLTRKLLTIENRTDW